MREIFERHAGFQAERPQMQHSTEWWVEKIGHENDELYLVANQYPLTRAEMMTQLFESADVMLSLVGYWQSLGVSPELATKVVLLKLEELEVRYPTHMFDFSNGRSFEENYREAREKNET